MGNSSSNVTSGVKRQADSGSLPIYKLCDLNGGGELVQLLKKATKGKNDVELDEIIRNRVQPFLYNNGEGKLVPIAELVYMRNKDSRPKNKQLQDPSTKSAPSESSNVRGNGNNSANSSSDLSSKSAGGVLKMTDFGYSLADMNGEIVFNKQGNEINHLHKIVSNFFLLDQSKFRECCWDVNNRGAVGETVLHICLLQGTSVHFDLAKRLLKFFPHLISDIYLSDEYYGENVLHMAIVNEDPAMVKYLLDNGVNYHQRCVGSFFNPEDQKMSRTDSLDREWVDLCVKTNYDGYVYWGEYPLSFAACLGQEECYRLVLAKGADPNLQDTNGNTVLHMVTIYGKIKMFDMAYELGALVDIVNVQKLTPLTLAATLAKTDIFMHILKIEREILWQIGDIVCAAYPLARVDTIDTTTGQLVTNSAVNLIVFGNNLDHLELLEGVVTDLLVVKWNTFIKFRFYQMFGCFFVYFLITFVCFMFRPVKEIREVSHQNEMVEAIDVNDTIANSTTELNDCYLLEYDDSNDIVRWAAEVLTVAGAVLYLSGAGLEIKYLGYRMFTQNLMTVPSRVLFLFSCCLITLMLPLRFTCDYESEDKVAVISMLTTAPYFLFFCRGFKMVGPFVVMIYRMIQGDLLRFVVIYLVFVLGFSQAYYIIFQSHDDEKGPNYFENPVQSILSMFIMSLQEFGDIYNEFDNTQLPILGKFMFMIYMALVAILLVNMLIAMFGMTYQIIAETRNEWQRQWARIVLVVERGVSPQERLRQQKRYSQPLADGRPALVLKHQMTEDDFQEMKDIREMKSTHIKNVRRREKGKNVMSSAPGSPQKRGSQLDIMAPLA
ncbi:hypothetical protein CHUAL_001812 [Chamberlinius hualienensis]